MFVKIEGSLVNLDQVYIIDVNDDGTATLWFTGTDNVCRDVTVDDMKSIMEAIRHECVVEDIAPPSIFTGSPHPFVGANLEDPKKSKRGARKPRKPGGK